MITGLKPKALLYRDGTSQSQRLMDALDPAYVSVDERTIGDLLTFAQQYAYELTFFDENNYPAGTWAAFLSAEATVNGSAVDNTINRKKWINEILNYLENPEKFSGDKEKLRRFSSPHLVLFISFLQLLGHVKDQLNTLTKKHLDFFYIELLRLDKKKPVPDVVNVIVELARDVNEFVVSKGTNFYAGKDSLGKDLIYSAEKDTIINQSTIESIKTLFVEKQTITLDTVRKNNVKTLEEGFTKMFELALGDPKPGDFLPSYLSQKVDYAQLLKFYARLNTQNNEPSLEEYINKSLFLSVANFKKIISVCSNVSSTNNEWKETETILEKAYQDKVKSARVEALRKLRENEKDSSTGFYKMFQFALGYPNPGNDLPIYKAAPANLETINKDLSSIGPSKAEAATYVKEELFLSESDFKKAMETFGKKSEPGEWQKVYADLELAQRKKRNFLLPLPITEEWLNVYSIPDARASAFSVYEGEQESSLRFNTFGKGHTAKELKSVEHATIGFAVSSPQLEMREGFRTIIFNAIFNSDVLINEEEILGILSAPNITYQPFQFFLSSEKEWLNVVANKVQFGNIIINASNDVYTAQVKGSEIIKTRGNDFLSANDKGKIIIWDDGTIYKILEVRNASAVEIRIVGKLSQHTGIRKYNSNDILLNAFRAELQLQENDLSILAPQIDDKVINITSEHPVLAMVLNQIPLDVTEVAEDGNKVQKYLSLYQQFKNLQLETVRVEIAVTGIKTSSLQNDDTVLNHKKSFEPFGFRPQAGSSLYFSTLEISQKQLQTLSLKFEWMSPPENLAAHYANYWKLKTGDSAITDTAPAYEIKSNASFTAAVRLVDSNATLDLDNVALFQNRNARDANEVLLSVGSNIAKKNPAFNYSRRTITNPNDDVIEWERYLVLDLKSPDFQHDTYPLLLTKQALINPNPDTQTPKDKELKGLQLNLPYTPKLKSLTLGYTASFEINFNDTRKIEDKVYHINAFGYKPINHSPFTSVKQNNYFLPYYKNEGELYIGIAKLQPGQNLSLLFQLAEGSANPDLEPPTVSWNYLSSNEWILLSSDNLVSDSTNGLLNTGIIEFNIPSTINNNNTVLSGQLHWLRASVSGNNGAISDTINIFPQGISAGFINNDNAPDHLSTLLPPQSIKELLIKKPEIKKINQPYTSSKGKPGEVDSVFYNRVSERLRHKNRALTMWDYERLVLERFPAIYKVKCLPATLSVNATVPGSVTVVVVPDIKGKLPFNPFQPKVPPETINEIQQFLEQRMPAFARLKVKNPSYLQVKVRFAVKIRNGYNEAFYTRKLEEELRRYLAPWAYNDGADITIGGKIYANVIVNFLAEKSYVDYVAGIKLFQSEDGVTFRDVRTINKGENTVIAQQPDVILVSALHHEVDQILAEGFEEKNFSGINYMKIGLDFTVA